MGITAYFGLESSADQKKINKSGAHSTQVYECDPGEFKEMCNDYPNFGIHIYQRGEIRLAYMKHLSQLRQGEYGYNMKILAIEQELDNQESVE